MRNLALARPGRDWLASRLCGGERRIYDFDINDVTINLSTDNNDLQISLLGWEFQTYQFV
jgi:hypothetical protein